MPDDDVGAINEDSMDEGLDRLADSNGSAPPGDAGTDAEADDLPAPPVVRCVNVSRWYGDVIAVNDLSVSLEPGITGLLGPNGAGKSTLIQMLVGLMKPSAGAVQVLGEDPWNNPDLLGRIGYVPEAKAPWRELSGRACALHAARFSGLSRIDAEEAVERRIAQVGLSDAGDQQVGTYSHGMQQRLKFALALLHDPEFLVLDEPLLGTDPLARRDLIQLMQGLVADGHSILLSTHVLPDVEALTDTVMVMDHGRLMAHGTIGEIRDLLDRFPRSVRIVTDDPRAVGKTLWEWDSVLSLQVDGNALTVKTNRPGDFYPELQRLMAAGSLPFSSVTSPDENVEAVFRYLVGRQ